MTPDPAATAVERPMRADARRNRERLLVEARAMFAEHGPDIGVAEIAKRAGVGSATVFRHFPTKEDLLGAVLEQVFGEIAGGIETASAMDDPWESFVHAITVVAEFQASNRLFLESAGPEVFSEERFAESSKTTMERMSGILERAQAAGVVRADLADTDLTFVIAAVGGATEYCCGPVAPPGLWRRYLAIVLDGLRPEGAHPLSPAPLTFDEMVATKAAAHATKG
ncbi:MAG: TetR/AcrR family transcriptional regulator [Solirubrobacteraceae bacterium]|nr:TetR/AcrR family transcriptional regulator [Patulibacter sp.]